MPLLSVNHLGQIVEEGFDQQVVPSKRRRYPQEMGAVSRSAAILVAKPADIILPTLNFDPSILVPPTIDPAIVEEQKLDEAELVKLEAEYPKLDPRRIAQESGRAPRDSTPVNPRTLPGYDVWAAKRDQAVAWRTMVDNYHNFVTRDPKNTPWWWFAQPPTWLRDKYINNMEQGSTQAQIDEDVQRTTNSYLEQLKTITDTTNEYINKLNTQVVARAQAEAERIIAEARAMAESQTLSVVAEQAKAAAEEQARQLEAARLEAEAKAKALAQAQAKAEADALAATESKARALAESEAKAFAAAQEKALAVSNALADAQAQAKVIAETNEAKMEVAKTVVEEKISSLSTSLYSGKFQHPILALIQKWKVQS